MIRLGLVGLGKIARDEHLPAIAAHDGLELVAVASRNATAAGVANYPDLQTMLAAEAEIDAIILCQPPQVRFETAQLALNAGKHVFLEKPPGSTISEVEILRDQARAHNITLFASWHSRWSPPVAAAKSWCAAHEVTRIHVEWKEDVRLWHPGQDWIWAAGGFGIFDPGINALSILTEAAQQRFRVLDALLDFPANRAAPIAARLDCVAENGASALIEFDWRQTGPQIWKITFEAEDAKHVFQQGGETANMVADGEESGLSQEYKAMFRHFHTLIQTGKSDVDLSPLQLVSDAFLRGSRINSEPFYD